jgi:hypothetical protein
MTRHILSALIIAAAIDIGLAILSHMAGPPAYTPGGGAGVQPGEVEHDLYGGAVGHEILL